MTEQASAQTAPWSASIEVRAGAVEGPGALADVWDVEVGLQGELLVVQPWIHTIGVFDAQGQYLRSVGRAGDGPGEFRSLGRIGWRADTLWVIDSGRLHLYNSSLEHLRTLTVPLPEPTATLRIIPGPLMADGSMAGIPIALDAQNEPISLLDRSGKVLRDELDIPFVYVYRIS
jgi:hypothetical protein